MKKIVLLGLSVVFVLAGAAWAASDLKYAPNAEEVGQAWDRVREYRRTAYDPASYREVPGTGLNVVKLPEIGPSLAVLVAAGELEFADMVLPTVLHSRASVKHWLAWGYEREGSGR